MLLLNGKPLAADTQFRDADGTQYPANWLRHASAEDRARVGITEAPDPEPYDERFYWGRDSEGNLIPKDADAVKEMRILEAKAQAAAVLAQTDWQMLRALERTFTSALDDAGKALAAEREALRVASNEAEAAIVAAGDVEMIAAIQIDVPAVAKEAVEAAKSVAASPVEEEPLV